MIDDYVHQPPLRRAAMWSLGLGRAPVPAGTLAILAGTDDVRARAYASILIAQRVAIETEGGLIPGPRWEEWTQKPSRSRPHHAAASAADEMAEMQRNVWLRVREACKELTWQPCDLARNSGTPTYAVARFLANGKPPLTAVALVLVARALRTTAEALMAPRSPDSARCSVRGCA